MTDWSKLKVAELKEECKTRNIPLTGLKLKQHYIDKLHEYDANNESKPPAEEESGEAGDQVLEDALQQNDEQANGNQLSQPDPDTPQVEETQAEAAGTFSEAHQKEDVVINTQEAAVVVNTQEQTTTDETDVAETGQVIAEEQVSGEASDEQPPPSPSKPDPQFEEQEEKDAPKSPEAPPTAANSALPFSTSTPSSIPVPPADLADDQRKRKRRSVTPIPDAEEVALKKARANDGTPVVVDRSSDTLTLIQEATDASQALREADGLPNDGYQQIVKPLEPLDVAEPTLDKNFDVHPSDYTLPPPTTVKEPSTDAETRYRSPSVERSVAPALHPATSSLYIRNFKRPLHIPTLKEHIVQLARRNSTPDSDPIKTFYLDSIRTHALISFTSPSAAGRVRAAMHETRFPDEPQREPLFVDYVPDEKVQEWIDQETGGGFGGGRNNRRYEVVYTQHGDGVKAILQDADTSRHRPSIPPVRTSISNVASRASVSSGIHPDRAAFVPREDRQVLSHGAPPKRDAGETGFKALDELFSFTTTKPKLYYKPVSPEVVDDRLDMVKGLRVGHTEMGRSGDEGMKRYTFERYKGREEWVDKGPEFGHGQRGQAMMRGDRGRGRGGGGGYRGGRGDTWRGR